MSGAARDYKGMSARDRVEAYERVKSNVKIADANRRDKKRKFFDCLEELKIWQRIMRKEKDDNQ